MTPEEKLQRKREKAAERKRNQRLREAEKNAEQIIVTLEPIEQQRAAELCCVRAVIGEPYSLDEYLSTLIARDWDRWQQEKADLEKRGNCPKCNSPLPEGCGGLWRGETACYRTHQVKELQL
jgi:hypothetical protein